MVPVDLSFRNRVARAVENSYRGAADDDAGRWVRIADKVIMEFARPTDAMIDAVYEANRFDEAWAINSRRDCVKAIRAMVRAALAKN